jgi:hypothetical protein
VDGFKSNPKMKSDVACYKEGGSVYKARGGKADHSDEPQDKAMVKKGIRQHEAAKHKGEEKTEIKLKQGGRCKKEGGNVRKYKAGGAIEMKKGKDDKKKIAQTKKTKAGKADTPSAATGKKKESPKTDNKAAKKTMTASMVGTLPETPQAPSAAMRMPDDQPIEMMADGGMAGMADPRLMGQGLVSDNERQMLRQAAMQRKRGVPRGANFGPLMQGQGAVTDAERGMMPSGPGMGAAASPGPMGNANPMGPAQDVMRGLQALGQYAAGGEVY